MKYRAYNENIIVIKPGESKTESGIILSEQDTGQMFTFEVVETNEITKDLQGKKVVIPRHKVFELQPTADGKRYAWVNYKDIAVVIEE